jgi:endonuclease-3
VRRYFKVGDFTYFVNKKEYFLRIFHKAEKRYGQYEKRLAGDEWAEGWQTLIATIMSAQTRDEVTIPVAEKLFAKYRSVRALAKASPSEVLLIIRSINFSKTKARNIVGAARYLIEHGHGRVPDKIEELVEIPGVGRKTANLVLSEVHSGEGICVDTHVHRISNVLGLVHTASPHQTELELMKIVPRKYWSRINRLFVLWGKEVRGRDKKKFLDKLNG